MADKAGLVVLNYPHNPTGALATPALFASALQFARRHQVPILHDFAYAAIGSAASDAPLSLFSPARRESMGSGNLYVFQDL
ncbi:aminotransferase class I/II-fold pyridoxal phosphate-dependent enzyme [Klebsiella variicola subsp. variicola]|nr:aminotransferase class I/II-fold pyridoxal phosphate-dependent enzyme [Klebsiella variicola subsp. variicola]